MLARAEAEGRRQRGRPFNQSINHYMFILPTK
jgi:hypothetical protein